MGNKITIIRPEKVNPNDPYEVFFAIDETFDDNGNRTVRAFKGRKAKSRNVPSVVHCKYVPDTTVSVAQSTIASKIPITNIHIKNRYCQPLS